MIMNNKLIDGNIYYICFFFNKEWHYTKMTANQIANRTIEFAIGDILYDKDMNQLSIIDLGPVPNKLIPEHDGDGRYIDIVISQKGYITNWYNFPSFEEFSF